MRSDVLKRLVQAHVEGDDAAFRKAAIQLAATEGNAGHTRVAEELRGLISKLPAGGGQEPKFGSQNVAIDIAQPRGDLAGLLTGGFRQERMRDIVLSDATRPGLERLLQENRRRAALEGWGVGPSRKVLFYGPPGCGKTLAAAVIAGELGLPLMTVRFDGLFSRFLGATAGHLKVIFDEMPRHPAVYLFDEFDAVAKSRGDAHEIGEVRRVVTSFLQLTDADRSGSIIIAATNFEALLDRAVFRRFDAILPFPLPEPEQLAQLIVLKLAAFAFSPRDGRLLGEAAGGMSYADAARACDDAIRSMVLAHREQLEPGDLECAFAIAKDRIALMHDAPSLAARSIVSADSSGRRSTTVVANKTASKKGRSSSKKPKKRHGAVAQRKPRGDRRGRGKG